MGIAVIWGDQQKSRLCFISDCPWTQTTLKAAVSQAVQLLDSSPRRVNVVIDYQAAPVSTSEFIGSAQFLRPIIQHANTRHILVVGASAETESLCKSYPAFNHFHFAKGLEDGHMLLSQLDYLSSVGGMQIAPN